MVIFLIWSNAQKGCYTAIRSGLICHNDKPLRFLTLTSVPDMARSITDCFKVLVNRIERMTPFKFINLGLISEKKLSYYFPDIGLNDFLKFDYLYVLTSEGANGVLHILYFGSYINEKWLKDSWENITGGARQLIIENVNQGDKNIIELSRYIVNQNKIFGYVAGQSAYVRHSYSKNWIYRGWRNDFLKLKRVYLEKYRNRFKFKVLDESFWNAWYNWLVSMYVYNSSIDDWLNDNL